MKDTLEGSNYDIKNVRREETHCTKCGTYLGAYGPGSDTITPCPKCKESNYIIYMGKELIVKRMKGAEA